MFPNLAKLTINFGAKRKYDNHTNEGSETQEEDSETQEEGSEREDSKGEGLEEEGLERNDDKKQRLTSLKDEIAEAGDKTYEQAKGNLEELLKEAENLLEQADPSDKDTKELRDEAIKTYDKFRDHLPLSFLVNLERRPSPKPNDNSASGNEAQLSSTPSPFESDPREE